MKYKTIGELTDEELKKENVIFCLDSDNIPSILIKNSQNKEESSTQSTDNMLIRLNGVLFNNDKKYYFHIIKGKKNDIQEEMQFKVIFDYVFSKITNPISDSDLHIVIRTIEEYFKISPDSDKINLQTGVYGELITLLKIYNNGFEKIIDLYHNDFYSKHDIEINEKKRIEIKATLSEKRIHKFKHNQLVRSDVNVLISSCILEKAEKGVSLFQLFKLIEEKCSKPETIFNLKKLAKRCGISDESQGLEVSFDKALDDLKFYFASTVPHLCFEEYNSISNIKYDVDLSGSKEVDIKEIISWISE